MTWVIIATGQSMNQKIADYVRGKCHVVAVSDAYRLAPWADHLVSSDGKWWMANPDAVLFEGGKYAWHGRTDEVQQFRPTPCPVNSGLMAMHLAHSKGANKIILIGFDMHGTHYFGKHTAKWGRHSHDVLANTTDKRFQQHIAEFRQWQGCEVINCTPDSALKHFPMAYLKDTI